MLSKSQLMLSGVTKPFVLKSDSPRRVGETGVLIWALTISHSLRERKNLLFRSLMEQFASNFPVSNTVSAANV